MTLLKFLSKLYINFKQNNLLSTPILSVIQTIVYLYAPRGVSRLSVLSEVKIPKYPYQINAYRAGYQTIPIILN